MKLCFVECGYTTLIISMHAIVLLLIGKVECFSSIGRTFRLTQNTPTPTERKGSLQTHGVTDGVEKMTFSTGENVEKSAKQSTTGNKKKRKKHKK